MADYRGMASAGFDLLGGIAEGLGISGGSSAARKSAEQAMLYELMREQERQPFITAGLEALPQFQALAGNIPSRANFMAGYQSDPGLQFEMAQGRQAIEGGAAARGNLLSGRTLQALQEFGQGLGATRAGQAYGQTLQGYQAQMSPLQSLMSSGLSASSIQSNLPQLELTRGDAIAGGRVGIGQTVSGTLGSMSDSLFGGGGQGGGGGLSSLFAMFGG